MDRWLNEFHRCDRIGIRDPQSLTALLRSYRGLVTYMVARAESC